jgi:hypothetical protein
MEPAEAERPDILPSLRLDELLAELQGRLQAVVAIGEGLDLESTLRRIVQTAVGLVDASRCWSRSAPRPAWRSRTPGCTRLGSRGMQKSRKLAIDPVNAGSLPGV